MSTDFRALCAELVNALDNLHTLVWGECPSLLDEDRGGSEFLDIRIEEALTTARAALAQPEPVAPTDEEIEEWADAATEVPLEEMDPKIHGWRRCFTAKEFSETIRAALARWNTPANNTRGTHFND